MFIVKSGQISIYKTTAQQERIPLGIISSGEYLAETGLLEGKTTHGTWAVALSDCVLIAIPAEAINEQLKTVPPWLISLSKGLAQKLRGMNDLMRRNRWYDSGLDHSMQTARANAKKKQDDES